MRPYPFPSSILDGLLVAAVLGAFFAGPDARAGNDFPLVMSTYLDTQSAEPVGLAYALDGTLVVGLNRGLASTPFGEIRRVDPADGALLDVLWTGAPLVDLAGGSGTSTWAALTDGQRIVGSADGRALADQNALDPGLAGRAVAVCPGFDAVLSDNGSDFVVQLYARGQAGPVFSAVRTDTELADIACDPITQRVFVTGYNQAAAVLQLPFVDGLSTNGGSDWRAWGSGGAAISADARGRVLRRSASGELWVAGTANGSISAFQRDPLDVSNGANLIEFDSFNQLFNLGGPNITFYGLLDPATGQLQRGQFHLARLSNGNGNTILVDDLDIDGAGRIHVGSRAFASMANRASLSVSNIPVAPYAGGDPSLLVAPSGLGSRTHWSTFIESDGRGAVEAVATSGDRYAFLIRNDAGSLITLNGPIGSGSLSGTPSAGLPYAWLGTWGNTSTVALVFADGFEN